MKNNLLEHIILYILATCVALIIATLARISASSMGFDGFTTFMVFVVTLGIAVIVYLSIHVVLQELMLPWIGKGLSKIPYFQNRVKSTQTFDSITEQLSLEDIRNEQLLNKTKNRKKN